MFTQTCFIRKNTKELQDKLLKLGYEEWDKRFFFEKLKNK